MMTNENFLEMINAMLIEQGKKPLKWMESVVSAEENSL